MSAYAGSLKFDTRIDERGFNRGTKNITKQISGMSASVGKLGTAIGIAFGVKQILAFGKACTDVASGLEEVQNVVDVTFGSMSEKVNEFSKTSIEAFGLNELSTKKYASSLGAMLKSMGLGQKEILNMSLNLTRLSADMASFYNLANEDAFTKIMAGMSGETEPLKRLGIDLRVANLEAYALAEGITKSYNAMSSSEKALLTYNYLMKVTADAQGDFARTSDSWANQTRILTEQFKALQGVVGQGLIAVILPVVKSLNVLLARLRQVADLFAKVFSGKGLKVETSTVDQAEKLEEFTGGASDNMGEVADQTKKAGKAVNNILGGFDEVNTLTKEIADSGLGDIGAGAGFSEDVQMPVINADGTVKELDKVDIAIQAIIDRMNELKAIFMSGFNSTVDLDFSPIQNQIASIKASLRDIFVNDEVAGAMNSFLDSFSYMLGSLVGGIFTIGKSIAQNLLGGISGYLVSNSAYIKDIIVDIFKVGSRITATATETIKLVTGIWQTVTSKEGVKVTKGIIGIFSNGYLGAIALWSKFGADMLDLISKPFTENADLIVDSFTWAFGVVGDVLNVFADAIAEVFSYVLQAYDRYMKPAIDILTDSWSEWVNVFIVSFNKHIKPIIDKMVRYFDSFINDFAVPAFKSFIDVVGKLITVISALWKSMVQPFVSWCIDAFMKNLAPAINFIADTVYTLASSFMVAVKNMLDFISLLLDGIINFKGIWANVWSNVGVACNNVMTSIKNAWGTLMGWFDSNVLKPLYNGFKSTVNGIASIAEFFANIWVKAVNTVIRALNKVSFEIPDIPGMPGGGKKFGINLREVNSVKLPRLAQGAVIPPNSEFMAILGDQKRGVNIETPLDTMVQAFKTAISEMGMGGTGRELVLEIDGVRFARATIPELSREMERMGVITK